MNRLQKKCFIASTGTHVLVALLFFIGPAFSSKTTSPDLPVLTFVPDILTDDDRIGGGNPNARPPVADPAPVPPPQPAPQPPQPKPEPKAAPPEPEPAKPQPSADSLELSEKKQPRKPVISTKLETKKPDTAAKNREAEQRKAAAERAERNRLADRVTRMAAGIREASASATIIDESYGPGGGGPTYAGYAAYVQSVYQKAWVAPDDAAGDSIAVARVTIANDGRVLYAEIISQSKDRAMDASVQMTLDRVPTVGRPFPAGSKDKERTYKLKFDLKVKRGMA